MNGIATGRLIPWRRFGKGIAGTSRPAPLPLPAIALDTWQPAAIELQPVATLGQGIAALPQVQAPPNALQPAQACVQDLQQALQHWIAAAPEATKTDAITLAAQFYSDGKTALWNGEVMCKALL